MTDEQFKKYIHHIINVHEHASLFILVKMIKDSNEWKELTTEQKVDFLLLLSGQTKKDSPF